MNDANTAGQSRSRGYAYDTVARLTRADSTDPDGACTRRGYTFDADTNRTALATSTGDVGAGCTSTGATTTSYAYAGADRPVTTGTVYDTFGRTTTQASGATIAYYAGDLVRQQTSGTSRQTWTLDAASRLAVWTTEADSSGTRTQTGSKTNHYGGDADSPDWIQESCSAVTRNGQGVGGDLDAVTSAAGDTVLQLTDIHDDVTVQLPLDTAQGADRVGVRRVRQPGGQHRRHPLWLARLQAALRRDAHRRPSHGRPALRPAHRTLPVHGPGPRRQRQRLRVHQRRPAQPLRPVRTAIWTKAGIPRLT